MSSNDKLFTERMLVKIKLLQSHVDYLLKGTKENEVDSIVMDLNTFDVSIEQLRHENSQVLICRYLTLLCNQMNQEVYFEDLVIMKDYIDLEIIVWVQDKEICKVFGLQQKDLSKYVENGQLAMLKLEDFKFFNWNEVQSLTGSS